MLVRWTTISGLRDPEPGRKRNGVPDIDPTSLEATRLPWLSVFLIGGSVSTGTLPADDPTRLVTYGYNPNTGSSYHDLNVPAGVT